MARLYFSSGDSSASTERSISCEVDLATLLVDIFAPVFAPVCPSDRESYSRDDNVPPVSILDANALWKIKVELVDRFRLFVRCVTEPKGSTGRATFVPAAHDRRIKHDRKISIRVAARPRLSRESPEHASLVSDAKAQVPVAQLFPSQFSAHSIGPRDDERVWDGQDRAGKKNSALLRAREIDRAEPASK